MGTYTLPTFADSPATTGPVSATNLNELVTGINGLDSRVINLEGFAKMPAGYQFLAEPQAFGTTATHGVGTLRAHPWVVTRPTTITKIGAEVSVIGDTGSKVRLGIYSDSGSCYPGTLLVDAGQIAGDSATVQELTISLTLAPGLYWPAAVVQSATTTQPTLRAISTSWTPPVPIYLGGTLPTAGLTICGLATLGITGALPSTFSSGGLAFSGTTARMFAYLS